MSNDIDLIVKLSTILDELGNEFDEFKLQTNRRLDLLDKLINEDLEGKLEAHDKQIKWSWYRDRAAESVKYHGMQEIKAVMLLKEQLDMSEAYASDPKGLDKRLHPEANINTGKISKDDEGFKAGHERIPGWMLANDYKAINEAQSIHEKLGFKKIEPLLPPAVPFFMGPKDNFLLVDTYFKTQQQDLKLFKQLISVIPESEREPFWNIIVHAIEYTAEPSKQESITYKCRDDDWVNAGWIVKNYDNGCPDEILIKYTGTPLEELLEEHSWADLDLTITLTVKDKE